MKIRKIISVLKKQKGATEAQASQQAHAMLALITGKYPRAKINTVVIHESVTIVCLVNGIQVKFDEKSPVPVWVYPEGYCRTNPKTRYSQFTNTISQIHDLLITIHDTDSKEEEKEAAKDKIDQILKEYGAKSVQELERRIVQARCIELGVEFNEELLMF